MDSQSAFNTIVTHLRKQGERCNDPGGMCLYRGEDGLQCAVGCLIPDDVYSEMMEGAGTITTLMGLRDAPSWDEEYDSYPLVYPELANLFADVDLQLLHDMQAIHDNKAPDEWEYHFARVSDAYGLSLPPIPDA